MDSITRIPIPPPPSAGLTIRGNPNFHARSSALGLSTVSSMPGNPGKPAFLASFRALTLSPIFSITSGLGPMKQMPAS